MDPWQTGLTELRPRSGNVGRRLLRRWVAALLRAQTVLCPARPPSTARELYTQEKNFIMSTQPRASQCAPFEALHFAGAGARPSTEPSAGPLPVRVMHKCAHGHERGRASLYPRLPRPPAGSPAARRPCSRLARRDPHPARQTAPARLPRLGPSRSRDVFMQAPRAIRCCSLHVAPGCWRAHSSPRSLAPHVRARKDLIYAALSKTGSGRRTLAR